jgi:membrane-associated protease RseP (regulator of RpoE activity)
VLEGGLPFAAALVAILFSHEMGHYVLARRHRVDTTLPYFIPVPFGAGTLGAVIRIRSALPSRRATLEIGAAGPIAGFVVAVPLLLLGLARSEVRTVAAAVGASPASPFAALRAWARGQEVFGADLGVHAYGDSLVTWAAQRLVFGPLPPSSEVFVHPVAFAAWLGLLVTTLNLVPLGQLDGGHVLYALLGRRGARVASEVVSAALLAAGIFLSWNWLFWWLLTRLVVGVRHPPALVEEPLPAGHRALALLSLLLFAVTFVPVPIAF